MGKIMHRPIFIASFAIVSLFSYHSLMANTIGNTSPNSDVARGEREDFGESRGGDESRYQGGDQSRYQGSEPRYQGSQPHYQGSEPVYHGNQGAGEQSGGQRFQGQGNFGEHPVEGAAATQDFRARQDLKNLPNGGYGGYGGSVNYYGNPNYNAYPGNPGMPDDSGIIWQSNQNRGN